jgi:PadR family transcriptional regulator PadR
VRSEWGTSENNRKAKFYSLTSSGRKQVREETQNWSRTVAVMDLFLKAQE